VGGWCPRGRRAEDGIIPPRYLLRETPDSDYAQRTDWNVRDADATLILTRGELTGGTRLTAELAHRYGRPFRILELGQSLPRQPELDWLEQWQVRILNLAGPRESTAPGIQAEAQAWLTGLFQTWAAAAVLRSPP
jgi:hypothetical protein